MKYYSAFFGYLNNMALNNKRKIEYITIKERMNN
jgi:hypothetical protein